MRYVAGLDGVPQMRGRADPVRRSSNRRRRWVRRIADKPAAVLLHLGPVWAAGWRTCTTRRAHTRWWWWSATHATYHKKYDARWSPISTPGRDGVGGGCVAAHDRRTSGPTPLTPSPPRAPGVISTLILPADVSWSDSDQQLVVADPPRHRRPPTATGCVRQPDPAIGRADRDPDRRRRHPRPGTVGAVRIARSHRGARARRSPPASNAAPGARGGTPGLLRREPPVSWPARSI